MSLGSIDKEVTIWCTAFRHYILGSLTEAFLCVLVTVLAFKPRAKCQPSVQLADLEDRNSHVKMQLSEALTWLSDAIWNLCQHRQTAHRESILSNWIWLFNSFYYLNIIRQMPKQKPGMKILYYLITTRHGRPRWHRVCRRVMLTFLNCMVKTFILKYYTYHVLLLLLFVVVIFLINFLSN